MPYKLSTIAVFFLLCCQIGLAQTTDSAGKTLKVKKTFIMLRKCYLDDKKITFREVKSLLKENPASAGLYQKSKRLKTQGILFYSVSAVTLSIVAVKILTTELLNITFSTVFTGKPDHYTPTALEKTLLAGGSALMLFSAVQYGRGVSAFKKSVKAFNTSSEKKQQASASFGITNTGNLGLMVNF
jgi:hypothetical protein